jgi:hypothetical protein
LAFGEWGKHVLTPSRQAAGLTARPDVETEDQQ